MITLLLIFCFLNQGVFADVHTSFLGQADLTVASPSVVLQNGNSGSSTIHTNGTSANVLAASPSAVYAHSQIILIGGQTFYNLLLSSDDGSGTDLTAVLPAQVTGRVSIANFTYPLTGMAAIPAGTWNFTYRAYHTGTDFTAHCDVNLLIRMANGTIRSIIGTAVAASANVGTSYSTFVATYSWSSYNVVQPTDYLEIDYYANVTTAGTVNQHFYLRIDDNTLALKDQTSVTGIFLPTTCDYVLRASNTGTSSWQIRLEAYSASGIDSLQNCTIYFYDSSGGISNQIVITNGVLTSQIGSWESMSSLQTLYIAITVQQNSIGSSTISTYVDILIPGTTTFVQYQVTFAIQ